MLKIRTKKQFSFMTNMSIQPLWLTHFIEILLVLEFQLTKFIVGTFSYTDHFRLQISSNAKKHFRRSSEVRTNHLCLVHQAHLIKTTMYNLGGNIWLQLRDRCSIWSQGKERIRENKNLQFIHPIKTSQLDKKNLSSTSFI